MPTTGWPTWPQRPPSATARALREFWALRSPGASTAVLGGCLAVALVAGPLTVGFTPGLGLAVVGALVWLPALPALVRGRRWLDLALAAASVALVAVVAVRDADWLVALCLLAALGAAAVVAGAARSTLAILLSGASWAVGVVRAVPWLRDGASQAAGGRRERVLSLVRSLALTLALLLVFGALFATADEVFASYLPSVSVRLLPGQVVVGVLALAVTASLAHLAGNPPSWSDLALAPARPARRLEWLLPVGSLAAMVVAFVLVQLGGVLGGHRHVLQAAHLTYAQYARHGFAQLVAVTLLTLVVVAVAARRAPRESARDRLVVRIALGVLCVGTLGVVASALRRVDLYVEAYGMSRLRMVLITGELFLAAVLLLVMVAGIRWRAAWLGRAVVLAAAVSVLALAALNPDARIVRYDAQAPLASDLDVSYLQGLSADAVPAMDALAEPLRSCLLSGVPVNAPQGWRDWSLGRSRAATVTAAATPAGAYADYACTQYFLATAP
ncbi:hypothetical protein GCM10023145_05630 [Angustibacter luteus]